MTNSSVKGNSDPRSTTNTMANSVAPSFAPTPAAIPDDVIMDRQIFNDACDTVVDAVRSAEKAKVLIDELSDHPLSWEGVNHDYLNKPHDSEEYQTVLMVLYDLGRRMTKADMLFDYIFKVENHLDEIHGMLEEKSASAVDAVKTESTDIKPAI
jgi:hypothetical protein